MTRYESLSPLNIPVEYEERALEEFESFLFFGAVGDTIIHIQPLITTLMCLVV